MANNNVKLFFTNYVYTKSIEVWKSTEASLILNQILNFTKKDCYQAGFPGYSLILIKGDKG